MNAIEIRGLVKTYAQDGGSVRAVDELSLSVEEGTVFGFLGQNGSGKTTTIRCLLGLAAIESGTCTLLGASVPAQLPEVIGRVGALVETPALDPSMTGRRNLELLAVLGRVPVKRVAQTLELVDLNGRGDDRVGQYSLGMRQRLGLAAALLKDPDVLILDEPANGLDPQGIHDIRELLIALAAEGKTVFISSHQLNEVEKLCDRVAIINKGRCILQGSMDEIRTAGSGQVMMRFADHSDALRALSVLGEAGLSGESLPGGAITVTTSADAGEINRLLGMHGLWAGELRPAETTLESVYLAATTS